MTPADRERADRHFIVKEGDWQGCDFCGGDEWPCDAAMFSAALDETRAVLLEVGHPTYFFGQQLWTVVPDDWFVRRNRALGAAAPSDPVKR